MRKLIFILILFPFYVNATRINMTVTSGNINNLTNAQSAYGVVSGDTLAIPGTLTGYCGIGNIVADPKNPIVVVVNAKVTPYQLEIGGPCIGVKFYFKLSDSTNGFVITGAIRGFVSNGGKVQSCSWAGITIIAPSDYPIYFYHTRTYNGTKDSLNYNLTFDSIHIYNGVGDIQFSNNGTSYLRGLWDSVTFKHCYIHDMSGGNIWSIQHYFHGRWYRNTIINTGYNDVRHVAVVHFGDGSGDLEENYAYRIYGDFVRFRAGTSLVADKNQPLDTASVANNILINFTKYSGVETNSDPSTYDTSSQYIRGVNYEIDNNTIGNLRDSNYTGVGLDVYKHYGFLKYRNNILFVSHMEQGQGVPGVNYYWSVGDGSPIPSDTTGTRYSQTGLDYLVDTVSGVSRNPNPGTRKGVTIPELTASWNGQNRAFAITYDIGPYQWSGRSIFTFRRGRLVIKSANNADDDFMKRMEMQMVIYGYLLNLQHDKSILGDNPVRRLPF